MAVSARTQTNAGVGLPARQLGGARGGEPERAPIHRSLDLERLAGAWQLALDGGRRALDAAGAWLRADELAARRQALAVEREQAAAMLIGLARELHDGSTPWLSPVPVTPALLGLPERTRAALFDLDGVISDSAVVHAAAWGEVFGEYLQRLSEQTGMHLSPFDRSDYAAYMDGRPRAQALGSFFASRGINPDERTLRRLAARKGAAVARRLRGRGVAPLPGARRYLEAAGRAGLKRGVISASAHTARMLERSGLATAVDDWVDASVILAEGLSPRPEPDILLAACRRLEVMPSDTATLTHSPAGVTAGRTAGLTVIAIAAEPQAELLAVLGAHRVAPSLAALLDRHLLR